MHVVVEKDAGKFLDKYEVWLKKKLVENSLMLDDVHQVKNGILNGITCLTVLKDNEPLLIATQTPPYSFNLSYSDNYDAVSFLVDEFIKRDFDIPGVDGYTKIVDKFIELYSVKTKKDFLKTFKKNVCALKKVSVSNGVKGEFIFAEGKDLDKVVDWRFDYEVEIEGAFKNPSLDSIRSKYEAIINNKNLAFWCVNGEYVSMMSFMRVGELSRIASVFTPKEYRGHGYASALIAEISKKLLDEGCEVCCLNADASNPTVNSMYQKIGYELVTDVVFYIMQK